MTFHILQIHYDEASRRKLDPGFSGLEVPGNPRPDWSEYWAIRDYFRRNVLNEEDHYGFLSPRFSEKTGLKSAQVFKFIRERPGADVYTFSPSMSQATVYLSVFEQGERHHPGIVALTQALLEQVGLPVDLRTLVNDFRSTVYCNYIIARPVFWDKWFAITERLFEIAEAGGTPLADKINADTFYVRGPASMKVFIVERIASLLLALMPELKVASLNIAAMTCGDILYYPCRDEMVMLDALKTAYLSCPDPAYLERFHALRHELMRRCDTHYHAERPTSFF